MPLMFNRKHFTERKAEPSYVDLLSPWNKPQFFFIYLYEGEYLNGSLFSTRRPCGCKIALQLYF